LFRKWRIRDSGEAERLDDFIALPVSNSRFPLFQNKKESPILPFLRSPFRNPHFPPFPPLNFAFLRV